MIEMYQGQSMTKDATICFSYTKEGEDNPVFLFFEDAYKKCEVEPED